VGNDRTVVLSLLNLRSLIKARAASLLIFLIGMGFLC